MPAPATSTVVRALLSAHFNLTADEVIAKARAQGVKAPDQSIRDAVYNIKSELRKKGAKSAPTAARTTSTAKPAPAPKVTVSARPATVSSAARSDLVAVLANVALVNTVVGACGGAEPARQVAEAVRACGGVEAFLQHLELVAGIRGKAPAE